MKRPLSLTVLAWFVIVSNVIGLISLPFSLRDPNAVAILRHSPLPLEATVAIAVVSEGLHLVAGVAILKRLIWGRTLYALVALVGFAISAFTTPFKGMLIVVAGLIALFLFILYRPAATAYFRRAA
ncbi:hypothetical protein [Burkholderia thailandensis]|uniref:Membrane protein n=2 Tax=Burkholderia thailandensis TaxID=57975 RepID=A0AAW9CZC6_BURTH|nr:hypothetical protein [Burkholderia thailandensis]ABC38480.1 conserved hypothetical protein [Burkholderia thailandensis E264]AHI65676.1 putative membrane protein [Burkholderia thailandensis H0587]AHI73603.1 putative membrane protein [Burkholderia thailandensis 2002721723]AHI78559.1 putative membrane protein [Burkholderia thailandensis E444]AIC87881.1 putative membrane protein [Burkholderia thailandensis USAMRU Malaysia \